MYSSTEVYLINEQNYPELNNDNPSLKENQEEKNPLQCNICGLIISNKWNFTLHMRVHNNDRRYKCPQCSSSFITSHDLKRHMLAHEGKKPRFKCQFCPKTYASRHSKYLHEDSHNKLKYKCRHCSEVFSKFVDRKSHEKNYHINNNMFFNCSECNKKFTSRRFLENHEKNYHKKEQNGFKCEECNTLFETSVNLNIHRRIHANKTIVVNETDPLGFQNNKVKTIEKKTPIELFGIRIHECIICTKRFTSRGDMLLHLSANHPEENKAIFKFACDKCDKSFKCKQGLSQHLITHTVEKKFVCSICDYKSKRSADLKVHMRKHTGEAPYVCEKCGRRFQQVKSFQHHKKQHFGKIFKCDLCDSSFYRSRELDWHKQRHSLGGFKCFKCEKLLANPYSLKSHLRIGKCQNQNEGKSDKQNIKWEKKLLDNGIRTGNNKFYECFACGFSTLSALDMTSHQIVHKNFDISKKTKFESGEGPLKEESNKVSRPLMRLLNKQVEKTDYKGTISVCSEANNDLSNSSLLFPSIDESFKVSDNIQLFNSNNFSNSEIEKLQEKIVSIEGKSYLAVEDLKYFDIQTLIHHSKIFMEG